MSSKSFQKNKRRAFTLMDVLVGMGLAGIIAAVTFWGYVTLQRGYNFLVAWSDLNNSLCRVRDSVEVDLHNALGVTLMDGTTAPSVQTLSLSIPQLYFPTVAGDPPYITGTATANPDTNPAYRAGDPHPRSVWSSGTMGQGGWSSIVGTGSNVRVIYSGSTNSATNKTWIFRTIIWTSGSSSVSGTNISWTSGTASRLVASFGNGVNIVYLTGTKTTTSGTMKFDLITGSSTLSTTDHIAMRMKLSGTTNDRHHPVASGTLQDTIYLRARDVTNTKTL